MNSFRVINFVWIKTSVYFMRLYFNKTGFRVVMMTFLLLTFGCNGKQQSYLHDDSIQLINETLPDINLNRDIDEHCALKFMDITRCLIDLNDDNKYQIYITELLDSIVTELYKSNADKSYNNDSITMRLKNLVDDYIGDRESPVADNELYIEFMLALNRHKDTSYSDKEIAWAMKNRRGTIVPDIKVKNEVMDTLMLHDVIYSMQQQSCKIMLYISDANCDYCTESFEELISAEPVREALDFRKIILLSAELQDVKGEYDVRTLPTIFMIGSDGKVIHKNLSVSRILNDKGILF